MKEALFSAMSRHVHPRLLDAMLESIVLIQLHSGGQAFLVPLLGHDLDTLTRRFVVQITPRCGALLIDVEISMPVLLSWDRLP